MFLKITANKFIVLNYHFSGPPTIYLFEVSNINCIIKCKICTKLTIEAPGVILVSLLLTLIIFDMMFFVFCFAGFERKWQMKYFTYCLNLNLSMHFRVRFRSIVGRGFLTPYFRKTLLLYCLPPALFFQILSNSLPPQPPPPLFSCCLVSLAEWVIVSQLI